MRVIFCFKQKTAYDMRISDWSSDVCSSDLGKWAEQVRAQFQRPVTMIDDRSRASFQRARGVPQQLSSCHTAVIDGLVFEGHVPIADMKRLLAQIGRASCRENVWQYV